MQISTFSSLEFPIIVTLYLLTIFQRSVVHFTEQLSELIELVKNSSISAICSTS